jgi:hypothetical protein
MRLAGIDTNITSMDGPAGTLERPGFGDTRRAAPQPAGCPWAYEPARYEPGRLLRHRAAGPLGQRAAEADIYMTRRPRALEPAAGVMSRPLHG